MRLRNLLPLVLLLQLINSYNTNCLAWQLQGSSSNVLIAYNPTPRPPGPDVSTEPIPCDEPLVSPEFPPLPNGLDLPGTIGSSVSYGASSNQTSSYQQNYNQSQSQPNQPQAQPQLHQHYGHVPAGAYASPQIKQRMMQQRQDTYNVNNANPVANPQLQQQANLQSQITKLGPEPTVNNCTPNMQTSSPTAVVINQSKTQDLSLPDDDFSSSGRPKYKAKGSRSMLGQYLMMPLQMGLGMGMGVGMSLGMSHLRY